MRLAGKPLRLTDPADGAAAFVLTFNRGDKSYKRAIVDARDSNGAGVGNGVFMETCSPPSDLVAAAEQEYA